MHLEKSYPESYLVCSKKILLIRKIQSREGGEYI